MNEKEILFNIIREPEYCLLEVKAHFANPPVTAQLKEVIDKLIFNDRVQKILFDLTDVEFVDSSFIGAIVYAHKNLVKREGKIAVAISSASVYDRFIIAQLDILFKIFNNLDEAKKSLLGN